MATFTNVDTNQIGETLQSIRQNVDTLSRISNTLENSVLSRLAPYWEGEAKNLFFRQFPSFNNSLRKLVEGYENLYIELEAAQIDYSRANDSVMSQVDLLQ